MPDLYVDLQGIDGFADKLDGVRGAFDASTMNISGFADQVGGPDLAEALNEFGQRWTSGREILTSYFSALSDMARASTAKLRATDKDLADDAAR
ncbi:MAG: hypothetical protein HOW97_16790 [Catenulispora sp.]|nr:hypothetical protein [Catenulispora sp.]